ncbi:CotH kinase family protein [Hymenobacter sp. DG01]|uniref:CotH kinase family protein n=1 Tax=Hymenobacter sp. DG01 TaxID=2584940 RepID=UPI00111EF22D|nr:CotH kinase family protein [Hymenobacter sp. DG01]
MLQLFTKRVFLLAGIATALGTSAVHGADTLSIASRFYHIDAKKKIIIVNQNTDLINTESTHTKSHLALDDAYVFEQPVQSIQTDSSYKVRLANTAYTVYFTQLPILRVATRKDIVDSPSVYAQFSLVEPSGKVTESGMGIEIRGGWSQTYPKKSFELSFWADTTGASSADVSLLGMRTDNKYNLQAMYNEPLRLRSKVANELWQEIHQIYYKNQEPEAKNGIAIQYVEVFINEEYRGIYALSERIDRKQLKLKKYNNGITGELYKGGAREEGTDFTGLPPFSNTSEIWGGFEYKHPEEKIDWTNLHRFVEFVHKSSDQDFFAGYQQKFNLNNAVDYFILLNLTRATDNTAKNLYIAKYKQGEPYYYVPWDLDGVFGTDWRGYETGTVDDILSNGFYDRLQQDCSPNGFRARLRSRWAELRTSVITETHIMDKFRTTMGYLAANNAYERENLAWAQFEAKEDQLEYTATWLQNRLRFLDATFSQSCSPALAATPSAAANALKLYPNPAEDYLMVEAGAGTQELSIRDLSGRVVLQATLQGPRNRVDVRALRKGLYVATIKTGALIRTEKLVLN